MKICPKCSSKYPDDMSYCSQCGESLAEFGNKNNDEPKLPNKNNQRRILLWTVAILAVVGFVIYKYYYSASYLILEPSDVVFPIKGEKSINVDINYDGHAYKITHAPSWVEVTKSKKSFTLKADPNNTGENRMALMIISCGKKSQVLPVTQQGKATYLLVNPQSLSFNRDSERERIDIDHDGATYEVDSYPSWLNVTKYDKYISVWAEENTTSTNKEGYIVLSSGDLITKVHVRQGGATTYIRFEPTSLTLPKGAGSLYQNWNIGVDFDGYDFDITYCSDWIEAEKEDNHLVISADDNTSGATRNGSITIRSGEISNTLQVRQNGTASRVSVDHTLIKDDKYGGRTYTIKVETDGTRYEVNYPSWLEVTCKSGYFTAKFPENKGISRSGTIRVKEDNVSKSISVEQGGKCSNCSGSGVLSCYTCNGQGGWPTFGGGWATCYACNGSREFTCYTCKGSGYTEP